MPQNKRPPSAKHLGDKEEAVAGLLNLLAELIARDWHRRTGQSVDNVPNRRRKAGAKAAKKPSGPPDTPN
jgi:hypothetical protein